jgi:hypothetical protein
VSSLGRSERSDILPSDLNLVPEDIFLDTFAHVSEVGLERYSRASGESASSDEGVGYDDNFRSA